MDFFENQDRARRKTGALVGYYILAVFAIMVSIYLVFVMAFSFTDAEQPADQRSDQTASFDPDKLWNPGLFLFVMIGTLLVVGGGTAYKIAGLSGGGESVASLLGGTRINRNTNDPDERKLLNIVEEMAIASGIPVPPVFLLAHESGINAFAAGFNPDSAVIGVTRGTVKRLSRDELQGVIAHEFSHILNGDMRLNIRLMGVLHGILLISLMGYMFLRSSMFSGRSRSSKDRGGGQIALLGFALIVIGYIGVFFGKLIKSAVSRQREYLADASAVQFTRNPSGIAGALKKIGGLETGSSLESVHAEEASHLFFSNGLKSSFLSLMSTHPPLEERIKRLDPAFFGDLSKSATAVAGSDSSAAAMGFSGSGQMEVAPAEVVSSVGTLDAAHLDHAAGMLAAIPKTVGEAARNPLSARAVIYNLLLSKSSDVRAEQLGFLKTSLDKALYDKTEELAKVLVGLNDELRLPVADIAVATLSELSRDQYAAFKNEVEKLVLADKQISLFEYTLHHMIIRHLEPHFEKPAPSPVKYRSVKPIASSCADVLSCIAYWGTKTEGEAEEVYNRGMAKLEGAGRLPIRSESECSLSLLDESLTKLSLASPAVKKKIMDACITCVLANNTVTVAESQTLRAVGDYLGCPVPPILGRVSRR